MKNIKTQTIPVDIQPKANQKTQVIEGSGDTFRKALQNLVGEVVSEEESESLQTNVESSEAEEEEFELKEQPWLILPMTSQAEPVKEMIVFNLANGLDKELPIAAEFVTTNEDLEGSLLTKEATNSSIQSTDGPKVPEFVLPESATEKATPVQQTTEVFDLLAVHSQVEEQVSIESKAIDSKPNIQTVEFDKESTAKTELISQPKVVISEPVEGMTMEMIEPLLDAQTSSVEGTTHESVLFKEGVVDMEVTTAEVEGKEATEEIRSADISASGQWTQMKLTAVQPQPVQTESVKVIPQEEFIQEIETMLVEDLGDDSTLEKVSTTRIQLTPKHLGEMEIELVLKNKELIARFVVEKAETKQWLEQKLTQLTHTLAEQNIKVEQFDVQVSQNQTSFGESSMNHQSFSKEQEKAFHKEHTRNDGADDELNEVVEIVRNRQSNNRGRLSIWV